MLITLHICGVFSVSQNCIIWFAYGIHPLPCFISKLEGAWMRERETSSQHRIRMERSAPQICMCSQRGPFEMKMTWKVGDDYNTGICVGNLEGKAVSLCTDCWLWGLCTLDFVPGAKLFKPQTMVLYSWTGGQPELGVRFPWEQLQTPVIGTHNVKNYCLFNI